MTAVRRPSERRPRKPPPAAAEGAASRIRPLLERYCKLAKVKLIARGADLYDMKLPVSERAHFGERASVRVALSLEALERDPDAEMAVLGSPFLGALLEAIRTGGPAVARNDAAAERVSQGHQTGPSGICPQPSASAC